MSNINAKVMERMSAARRNAESLMPAKKRTESTLKRDQQRERDALAEKTRRLRELRLAKEAADRAEAEANPPKPKPKPKARATKA
jgi:hypothetical protein